MANRAILESSSLILIFKYAHERGHGGCQEHLSPNSATDLLPLSEFHFLICEIAKISSPMHSN